MSYYLMTIYPMGDGNMSNIIRGNRKKRESSILVSIAMLFASFFGSYYPAHFAFGENLGEVATNDSPEITSRDIIGPLVLRKMLATELSYRAVLNSHSENSSSHQIPSDNSNLAHLTDPDFQHSTRVSLSSQDVEDLGKIFDKYEKRREADKIGVGLIRTNNFIINSALDIGLSATGSYGRVIGKTVSQSLKQMTRLMETELKSSSQKQLKVMLNNYRNQTNDHNFEEFNGKAAEEIFETIHSYQSPIYQDSMNNISEEARPIANTYMIKSLQDMILSDQLKTLGQNAQQDIQIQESSAKISVLTETMYKIQVSTSEGLANIERRQEVIVEYIENVDLRVTSNTHKITNIQLDVNNLQSNVDGLQILSYENMSPKERLSAFNRGLLPENMISESDREKLEIQADQQESLEDFGTLVTNIGGAVTIANNLNHIVNLPEGLLEAANTVSQLGSLSFNAAASFASGNIFGGVVALTGLFGLGKKKDNGMQKAIQGLFEGQKKILESINTLSEGQANIMNNQQKILDSIGQVLVNQEMIYTKLNEKIDRYQEENRASFENLETLMQAVSRKIDAVAFAEIALCDDIVKLLNEEKRNHSNQQLRYSQYQSILNSYPITLQKCVSGIFERTSIRGDNIDGFLLLKNHLDYPSERFFPRSFNVFETEDFLRRIYDPALFLFIEHHNLLHGDNLLHSSIESMSESSGSYHEITMKLNDLSNGESRARVFDENFNSGLLRDYLSPYSLIEIAPYIMNVYPFLDVLNLETYEIPDYNVLIRHAGRNNRRDGFLILKKLQKLVRLSLIQENIISGDLILPIYYHILMDEDHPDQNIVKNILASAGPRSILIKNLTRFVVLKELEKAPNLNAEGNMTTNPIQAYLNAFNEHDLPVISELLNNEYNINILNGFEAGAFWNLIFPTNQYLTFSLSDINFLLPKPFEIESEKFEHTHFYNTLLELSYAIDEQVLDYVFADELPEEEQYLLNKTLGEVSL